MHTLALTLGVIQSVGVRYRVGQGIQWLRTPSLLSAKECIKTQARKMRAH